MSYLALARKWRPRTFAQLIGQNHISKALIKSLNEQRLHHAYLFTGTRGVGKTSIARLMAKALNCELGISATPCLSCDACLTIEQGRFIDLIEVDGASKTRIEDTRDILENIQYAPTNGRVKIYLIDEVHMLSQSSFNALLKTLEEPPEHVKFLLATTDPQKLPITILSRCLQFNLKPIADDSIAQQLQYILEQERLLYEPAALELIAHAARGSMRDALSLLDQAIAGSESLAAEEVKTILGHTQQDYALFIVRALAELSPVQLVKITADILKEGGRFTYVLDELIKYFHQIMVSYYYQDGQVASEVAGLAQQFKPEDIQLFYQIALKGSEEIHLAPTLAIGFEMVVLRMYAFRPVPIKQNPKLVFELASAPKPRSNLVSNEAPSTKNAPIIKPATPKGEELVSVVEAVAHPISEDWSLVIKRIKLGGLALNALENAEFVAKSKSQLVLAIAKGHHSLFTPGVTLRIEEALSIYYNEKIKLTLEITTSTLSSPAQQKQKMDSANQSEAVTILDNDDFFNKVKQQFSAEVVKNSIELVKKYV